MFNRRTFLKTSAAALPLAATLESLDPIFALSAEPATTARGSGPAPKLIPLPARLAPLDPASEPWQRKIHRVGQTNMTEHDPAVMNVEEWANYWHSTGAEIVFVSVTGILAFYPSKVKFHRHGKFLHDRDFFGECVAAAKKRGMRVVARMSPDLNWGDALEAHPEWAMRNADGSAQLSAQDPRLFETCMFSTYMDDYIPAVMREVNSLYDVDCFYTNAWPPARLPKCHCAICSKLPPAGSPAYWEAFNDRIFELWRKYDAIAKEKKPDNFYFGNLGANIHASPNLARMGKTADWFQADNQGRSYNDPEVWGCTIQGRACNAVLDGKFAANVTGGYSTGAVVWRNGSKTPDETKMWLNETLASGMALYYHFVGGEDGLGEDRRWQSVGENYFRWSAKHDAHLRGRRTVANIGVVMGQRTQLFYKGPAAAHSLTYMRETTYGLYDALLNGRYAFDFVHEDRLEPAEISKYRALLLPNIAMLSDRQCRQISDYVQSGGSIMASFETGLYDENLKRRPQSGLAGLLGIHSAADVVGTNGNACYSRIERQHPVLAGFTNTNWLPGTQNRLPLHPIQNPLLTVVPGFVAYPPELAYPPVSHTDEPAIVLRDSGSSRIAYFPGDIEYSYWITGHGDLLRLLDNTIRWVTGEERMVEVSGDGFVEMFAWETAPGYAVHLLNYTNPNSHHGWMQSTYPIGPQTVTMKLPSGVRVKSAELLRAERTAPFRLTGDSLRFTIPRVDDYEVAAITTG